MKKLFAVIISVAMILSMSALFTSAIDVVGDIEITYDADASTKLTLTDGDISDWAAAGYKYITLSPSNFHEWSNSTIPDTFAINCYFVADADNLYVGFWINDEDFTIDADGCDPTITGAGNWRSNAYWGDAFQIAIDFDSIIERWCDEEDMDFGNNKNIFYSFASYGNGTPITIVREETYNNNGYLSEANGDDVSGSTNEYEGGWCAEFSLSWQMLYDDYLEKTDSIEPEVLWNEEKNLSLGITLCYIDHNEAGHKWSAGTFDSDSIGWLATDNGIHLQLPYEDGRTINCSGVEYPGKGADAPVVDTTAADTTAADTVADTTAPETTAAETTAAETTAAATTAAETTAAATTAAETTAAPAAATTAAATTAASGGCGSVVGAGAAVVVLSAIVAGAALSKKRD